MIRDLQALTHGEFDLLIVGGGAFGACAAWDAAQRGLSVALIERGDFSQATSANHFKMVHGGIRYLQHLDLPRIRESVRERRALLRIAPHLVYPLPIAIPTYGHGRQGKSVLAAGLKLYDLLSCGRNRGIADPLRRIPPGRMLSRQECLRLFPGLEPRGLTGAGLFYDGQMYNPPRLALAFLQSAVTAGAQIANYVEAKQFLARNGRVYGVQARDVLTDTPFDIRSKMVLNAAGPWAERLLEQGLEVRLRPGLTYSRDACFLIQREMVGPYALAVQGRTKDPDALLSREHRHLFLVPWRGVTLIGVWHVVYRGDPDGFTVTEQDLQGFLSEINDAYPPLALTLDDVAQWNAGLVLFGENQPQSVHLRYGKRSCLIDHERLNGVERLVTLIGVRATTARGMAAQAIDLVCHKLGQPRPASQTAETPLYGGEIEAFEPFLQQAIAQRPPSVTASAMPQLVHNYGSAYREVLKYLDEVPSWAETVGQSNVLQAEIIHAVREEMAQKLSDVVLRRTELGTAGCPEESQIRMCASLMAAEAGWSPHRLEVEIEDVLNSPNFRWASSVTG